MKSVRDSVAPTELGSVPHVQQQQQEEEEEEEEEEEDPAGAERTHRSHPGLVYSNNETSYPEKKEKKRSQVFCNPITQTK
ncbi:hypothetical protein F2P81_013875 [Scophthalmus maximus]|uniref:Uncharacterized protein n=1 Tax=Scophthalmus maximus TaxID=52904 RepID=A0A6A4SMG9_SCOMX|nr:hypothetical protein F2P81_013875 [Scophthalmus maximus]